MTLDTVCVDEVNCNSLAGSFNTTAAWAPRMMSTNIANPTSVTPVTRIV